MIDLLAGRDAAPLTEWLHDHEAPAVICRDRASARAKLADGLRYQWRASGLRQRRWLQARWDQLEYDHRWLTELTPEPPPAPHRLSQAAAQTSLPGTDILRGNGQATFRR
ncbi:hypothetical protein [Actinoplanes regularis]|uniref:hypothetical protein n=1 Tax=Actinoplanes regularis TaxID=52697 RepID=UPI00117796F7|nr:hypothetical protein [Actinoplanes regularis]